jgi:hypothetical protein
MVPRLHKAVAPNVTCLIMRAPRDLVHGDERVWHTIRSQKWFMEDASAKEIVTRIWGTARHNSPRYECLVASPMPYKFGAYLGGERASANGGLGIIIRYHTSVTLKSPFNHINSKAAHDGHKIQLCGCGYVARPIARSLQLTGKQGCLAWSNSICL